MKKIFITLFIFVSLFALNTSSVSACSCIPPVPPTEAIEQSSAVFSGLVTNLENDEYSRDFNPNPVIVTVEVMDVWKGIDSSEVTLETARQSATCGYNFEEGEEYLIYAHGPNNDLSVSACSRTSLLSNAQNDIEELGDPIELILNEPNNNRPTIEQNFTTNLIVVGGLFAVAVLTLVFNRKKEEIKELEREQ
ncbi:MAG: hypothetical protein WDZ80_02730 [Candidatus Paceibacterota bacterium]